MSRKSFSISSIGYQVLHQYFSKQRSNLNPLKSIRQRSKRLGMSSPFQNTRLVFSSRSKNRVTKIGRNTGSSSWLQGGGSIGMLLGLSICFVSTKPSYAEASSGKNSGSKEDCESVGSAHGKQVYTNYSITGIPGDGRCLFRYVAHGACYGPETPLQRRVADEFIKRREESEWFVEGDFDSYVSQIRKPHVWGGEPELFMASHVLQMPITVYMYDENAGGLISIAEYGQEYGKENPIRVLYHGFGHYDALLMPGKNTKSKL
ncbi:ubiquitinyl hydrolase 1 [Ranunculus cassubicifolius]